MPTCPPPRSTPRSPSAPSKTSTGPAIPGPPTPRTAHPGAGPSSCRGCGPRSTPAHNTTTHQAPAATRTSTTTGVNTPVLEYNSAPVDDYPMKLIHDDIDVPDR